MTGVVHVVVGAWSGTGAAARPPVTGCRCARCRAGSPPGGRVGVSVDERVRICPGGTVHGDGDGVTTVGGATSVTTPTGAVLVVEDAAAVDEAHRGPYDVVVLATDDPGSL